VRSYSRCASSFSSVTRLPRAATHAPNQIVSSRPSTKATIASGRAAALNEVGTLPRGERPERRLEELAEEVPA
jgi:hypothetical protein